MQRLLVAPSPVVKTPWITSPGPTSTGVPLLLLLFLLLLFLSHDPDGKDVMYGIFLVQSNRCEVCSVAYMNLQMQGLKSCSYTSWSLQYWHNCPTAMIALSGIISLLPYRVVTFHVMHVHASRAGVLLP